MAGMDGSLGTDGEMDRCSPWIAIRALRGPFYRPGSGPMPVLTEPERWAYQSLPSVSWFWAGLGLARPSVGGFGRSLGQACVPGVFPSALSSVVLVLSSWWLWCCLSGHRWLWCCLSGHRWLWCCLSGHRWLWCCPSLRARSGGSGGSGGGPAGAAGWWSGGAGARDGFGTA